MVLQVPRETVEFSEVTVTLDGTVRTTGVEFAVTPDNNSRPTTWAPAVVRNGKTGLLISGRSPGSYRIFARITDGTDQVVRDVGIFVVS